MMNVEWFKTVFLCAVKSIAAFAEPAVRDCLNIIPALAQGSAGEVGKHREIIG
jgi:hypothetical protein